MNHDTEQLKKLIAHSMTGEINTACCHDKGWSKNKPERTCQCHCLDRAEELITKMIENNFIITKMHTDMSKVPKNTSVFIWFKNPCGMMRTIKAFYATKYNLEISEECDNPEDFGDWHENMGQWFAPEGWYEDTYSFDDPVPRLDIEVIAWCEIPVYKDEDSSR